MKPLGRASLLTLLVLGVNMALLSPAKAQSKAPWKSRESSKTQIKSLPSESHLHGSEQTLRDGGDPHLTSQGANKLELAILSRSSTSNLVIPQTPASDLESSLKLNEFAPSISPPIDQITPVSKLAQVQSSQSGSQEQKMPDLTTNRPIDQITPVSKLAQVQSSQSSSQKQEMPDLTTSPLSEPIAPVSELGQAQSSQTNSQEQEMLDFTTGVPMEQVTDVTQLSDVRPSDWAFEALRSLVERYGCIAGYPDATFRGNRALSRYEFAAGLNSCLNQIERLISSNVAGFVTKEDLAKLERLQAEFKVELASLGTRVDELSGRVAFLDSHQFSTTTTLSGRVEFAVISAFGDKKAVPSGQTPSEELNENAVLGGTAILFLNTSFTGKDNLGAVLVAGNLDPFRADVTGTDMTSLDFGLRTLGGIRSNTDGSFYLGPLTYRFPIGNSAQATVGANGLSFGKVLPNINYAATLSAYGTGNPFYLFASGAGAGIQYNINDKIGIGAAYVARSASNTGLQSGLFGDGGYGAAAQITLHPFKGVDLAMMYAHLYTPDGGLTGGNGSQFAQFPFGNLTATSADAFSLELSWRVIPQFGFGIWGGYLNAKAESSFSANGLNVSRGANSDIWYWALGAEAYDLLLKGSELGFVFGMPPKLSGSEVLGRLDQDTSYHVEGYFSIPLATNLKTNQVSVYLTPGFVGILNPEHNNENNDIWIGTVVLTFYF